ncbi:MAG TPA: hypothetical protein VF407_08625 [Polyangiaceae bacterium]
MRARRNLIVPNLPLHAAAFVASAAGPLLLVVGALLANWNVAAAGGVALMLFGRLPWIAMREKNVAAKKLPAEVVVENGAITVDGERVVSASEIEQAYVFPRKDASPTVRVLTKTQRFLPKIDIEVENASEGEALLEELGFGATQAPAHFRTLNPLLAACSGLAILPLAGAMFLPDSSSIRQVVLAHIVQVAMILCGLGASLARIPRRVTVLPDGIETSYFGRLRKRFAFAHVKKASFMIENGIFTTTAGKTLRLRATAPTGELSAGQRSADQLVERAMTAYEAFEGPKAREEEAAIVEARPLPEKVRLLKTNWASWGAAVASTVLAIVIGKLLEPSHHGVTFPLVAFSMFSYLYVLLRSPNRLVESAITRTAEGLQIGDRTVARVNVENAYVRKAFDPDGKSIVPRDLRLPRVIVTGKSRGSSLQLVVPTEGDARAVVDALDIDPKTRVMTFRVHGGIFSSPAINVILAVALGQSGQIMTHVHGVWRALYGVVVVAALVHMFWPKRLRIGADGVLVTSPWKKTFFAYGDLSAVETASGGVVLVAKDGTRTHVRTMTGQGNASPDRDAILERLQAGIRAAQRDGVAVQFLVERGDLTPREWIERMRALGQGGTDYRVAGVDEGALWRVVEDAAAPPATRIAAATSLRIADDRAKTRLRATAEATASPELKDALDAIAAEDDEALVRALGSTEKTAGS